MLSIRDDGSNALSGFQYYYYHPSMAAAIIFIVLFGVATSLHTAQMLRTRTWFMIPFVVGGICMFRERTSCDRPEIHRWHD